MIRGLLIGALMLFLVLMVPLALIAPRDVHNRFVVAGPYVIGLAILVGLMCVSDAIRSRNKD
jgi:hypothetical protein